MNHVDEEDASTDTVGRIREISYRTLAKYYCTTWLRILWEENLEIAERSLVFSPQMIVPSGTVFSRATVSEL
jgi:hypothetical protein